jgi:lysophospholipase L1-like esterase
VGSLLVSVWLVTGPFAVLAADHDFARWEKAIKAFEQEDARKPPPKQAILFIGSSSIRKWNLGKSFPDRATINRGFGGSEIVDSTHFAPRILLVHEPRIVVLYAGDNDLARGRTPQGVHEDFQKFVKIVHDKLPKTRILFVAIKPSIKRFMLLDRIRQANELIKKDCARDERLVFVDVFTPMLGKDGKPRGELFVKDGLHLNARGYQLWADLVRPHLK